MAKYRKKPVVIEAVQWTGENQKEIKEMGGMRELHFYLNVVKGEQISALDIKTLEGIMTADKNDWIIKGISGELYPCKPDIFEKTYELVE